MILIFWGIIIGDLWKRLSANYQSSAEFILRSQRKHYSGILYIPPDIRFSGPIRLHRFSKTWLLYSHKLLSQFNPSKNWSVTSQNLSCFTLLYPGTMMWYGTLNIFASKEKIFHKPFPSWLCTKKCFCDYMTFFVKQASFNYFRKTRSAWITWNFHKVLYFERCWKKAVLPFPRRMKSHRHAFKCFVSSFVFCHLLVVVNSAFIKLSASVLI